MRTSTDMPTALSKSLEAYLAKPLPVDFVLGDNDVICGRGSRCFNHAGNKKFRKMVEAHLERYKAADSKLAKSEVIWEIVNLVRAGSPGGGFVKKDKVSGLYYEVGDFLAREKTSQTFRDALCFQYKSSNATKRQNRLKQSDRRGFSAPTLSVSCTTAAPYAHTAFSSQKNSAFSAVDTAKVIKNAEFENSMEEIGNMFEQGNRSINSVFDFDFNVDSEPIKLENDFPGVYYDRLQLDVPRSAHQTFSIVSSYPNLSASGIENQKGSICQHYRTSSHFDTINSSSIPSPVPEQSSPIACGKRNILLERIMRNRGSQEQSSSSSSSLQTNVPYCPVQKQREFDPFEEMAFEPIQEMSDLETLMQLPDDQEQTQDVLLL